MQILHINPKNRKERNQFNSLPELIYANNDLWVPPLAFEARRVFDQQRHSFYQHGEAAFFVAVQDGSPVGRLAVMNNHTYNKYNQEKTAFFYLFESVEDEAISSALFNRAFDWCRLQGLTKIVGPKGFSVLDGMGLLIKGFEFRPAFGIPYNPPYYQALIEQVGFSFHSDSISGHLGENFVFPEKILKGADLVAKRYGFKVLDLRNRKELKKAFVHFRKMYNDALEGTSGNMPITDVDIDSMTKGLLWIADPRLVKLIMKDEDPVGFLIAYPDVSEALQRNKGKLFPLGWLDVLMEARRTNWININGAGIVAKYRRMGATAMLFAEMFKSVSSGKARNADIVQIGTDNEQMCLELSQIGIDFYKTHRIFQKDIES